LNNDVPLYANAVDDWIYYCSLRYGMDIYAIKTDGSGRVKLNDDKSESINIVGDWIYYINWDDGLLYTIKTDGTGRQVFE